MAGACLREDVIIAPTSDGVEGAERFDQKDCAPIGDASAELGDLACFHALKGSGGTAKSDLSPCGRSPWVSPLAGKRARRACRGRRPVYMSGGLIALMSSG